MHNMAAALSSSLPPLGSGNRSPNPTYSAIAVLRDGLRSSKVTDRRNAARALLEKLHDQNTLRRLEVEALRMFENADAKAGDGGRGGGGGRDASGNAATNAMTVTTLPWDRVCILYRSLLDAALLSSRTLLDGRTMTTSGSGLGGRKRAHANQSGFTGRKTTFSADDVLLPYKVFLRMDSDLELECNDGGCGTSGGNSLVDWKTRPRHGHHVDVQSRGGFHSTRYVPHVPSDDDRGSRLSKREVSSCVDYAVRCLNDDDVLALPGVETSMLQWLSHICSRPAYLAELEVEDELGHVLHELSTRLGRAFFAVNDSLGNCGRDRAEGQSAGAESSSGSYSEAMELISQESLLAASKCLCAMMFNCTVRLGMNLHLFLRPVLQLVADWAESAWILQTGGGEANTTFSSSSSSSSLRVVAAVARNPHARMIEDGRMADPLSHRRRLRTEADVMSLLPYLYSTAANLLAAHPEHCVPVLSDCGHALLRLARKNYGRTTTSAQAREALTEYIGAHLLVAETSGKICGLPEGDLGPLMPRSSSGQDENGNEEDQIGDYDCSETEKSQCKNKRRGKGATLDTESINKLLEMIRDEKVLESLSAPAASNGHRQDGKKKKDPRRSLLSGGNGGSDCRSSGMVWTPLTRRQRRHWELMARLLRISHRLYLTRAEDREGGGITTCNTLECLVALAEEDMLRSSVGDSEIDILPRDELIHRRLSSRRNSDDGRIASPGALAHCPWIRIVGRHLYKLNPKLGSLIPSSSDTSSSQDTMTFTMKRGGGPEFLGASDPKEPSDDGTYFLERNLLESCPMLQSLVVDESTLPEGSMTALTPNSTITHKSSDVLDSIQPTIVSTLQFLCACAESFPRGECWASSARKNWSTFLDEGSYPDATLANVLERHGSSSADAAAVVYLLGTTLESQGGSLGNEDIQLWTIVALLKMTESSAIICSRESSSDAATFESLSSARALHLAWQYVWKTLFRYDLRYSCYTSSAYSNNVGELIIQLLTQILRYQCAEMEGLCVLRLPQDVRTSKNFQFIRSEHEHLWSLPVFDDASYILSCAPFELITNTIRLIGFCEAGEAATPTSAADAIDKVISGNRDRRYFVSLCLKFVELAMRNNAESSLRRSFLPYAATSLAALVSNGDISSVSTFELDGLNLFAITEDIEPLCHVCDPENVDFNAKICINQILWTDSITPNEYLYGIDHDIAVRIVQGRGAILNRHLNAQYEREQLRRWMKQGLILCVDNRVTPTSSPLGSIVFISIKSCLDELLFQLRYEDGNASDDDEMDSVEKARENLLALPKVTALILLMLTVLLSNHSTVERTSQNLCDIFEDNFSPAFDLLLEKLPSLKSYPSDFFAVFNHLHGIVRALNFISAFGGGGNRVSRLFGISGKSLSSMCKSFLKDFRNISCTSRKTSEIAVSSSNQFNFDSDEDLFNLSKDRAQIRHSQTQHSSRRSTNSDESDGLMDDDDYDDNFGKNRNHRPRLPRAPPSKRLRMENESNSRLRNDFNLSRTQFTPRITDSTSIDAKCAWACSSLMLLLQPSFQSLEFISSHLVWPEDCNKRPGYGTVSKLPDPCGALVCAILFCRKSVILTRDRLDLHVCGHDADEDQKSALILSLETILQAKRCFPPSSKHFMCGLELVAEMARIREYSECCGPISNAESRMVLEALHPEGLGKESCDFSLFRRWKRILKYRSSYQSQKVLAATAIFIVAQKNLRKQFEGFIRDFICTRFCHIDESVRSLASNLLGAALIIFPDQNPIVVDVLKNALPKLEDKKKIRKWIGNTLVDQKLRDEMIPLEEDAFTDAEGSIEYNSIMCIGMIAGHASDGALARDMIWRLIDLATRRPTVLLACYRACKRASFLRRYPCLSDMFDDMLPHFLVKWLESKRSLTDFPLLFMSPSTLERACRYLPNELLSMLIFEGGWNDDFFNIGGAEAEIIPLNEGILTSFVGSVAQFLIPNILLSSSNCDSVSDIKNQSIDTMKYLTECVLILTGLDNDDTISKVLLNHISDLYGYVAVLGEGGDAALQCENAFKLLKRCVSSVHIERTGAKCSFLVLRHILLLHRIGMAVVGLGDIELTSKSYIDGIKYVSNQLKGPSKCKQGSVLEQLGSSLTESMIIVKYWLSSSQTARQREETWGTLSLLCELLIEYIVNGVVESGELRFCLHTFITVILDPTNTALCPLVLSSLKDVLSALFSIAAKKTLVQDVIAVIHKLSLILIQIHQRAYDRLRCTCESTLRCLEYEQTLTLGLLSIFEETDSSDSVGEGPWILSTGSNGILQHLIASKADLEEKVSSDTMLVAYDCLEIIANSESIQIEDIAGAEDIIIKHDREEVYRNVNERYSLLSLFDTINQRSTKIKENNLTMECENFIRVMNEHPITSDEFESSSSYSNHDVLARRLALGRLERALLAQHGIDHTHEKMLCEAYPLLLRICHSREPEQSRVISSRCLGELYLAHMPTLDQESPSGDMVDESLVNPILSIKKTVLTSLGRFLLSDCAETSLVAMKTAKAIFVTPVGKECWELLDSDVKSLLSPFNTHDDGKVRREAVGVSNLCIERLKSLTGCLDGDSWCWHDKLWTLGEEHSCELWIREITISIISCSFGEESKIDKGNQDFFRICQGLCATEASFAASVFPALIFHLLDAETRDKCRDESRVRDSIMSNIAIGSPTSRMNGVITHCFTRILSRKTKHQVASQAITVILNTLELLRAITEHRFLTSPDHSKNKQKENSILSKKRRSDNYSFERSEQWRGIPYGVVLRVSGLDVAQACFRIKRYFSAIYYAEMSMNNIIGTGTFFEDIANDSHIDATLCDDISGFGVSSSIEEYQKCRMVLEKALVAKDIIGRCLSELNARDELQGILSQGFALNLKRNITSLLALERCHQDRPLVMLSDLDTELLINPATPAIATLYAGSSRGIAGIAWTLDDLGLNHTKHKYLTGHESIIGKNSNDRYFLREEWFADALYNTNQWDDFLLPRLNDGNRPSMTSSTHRQVSEIAPGVPSLATATTSNFYESVHAALQSFFKDDTTAGLDHALRARLVVLEDMKNLAGSEAQSTAILTHLTKLSLIGHLELLATTLDGTSDLAFLLGRWGYHECLDPRTKLDVLLMSHNVNFNVNDHPEAIDGVMFRATRLECSLKEISLKILTNKFVSFQELVVKALASHIFKSCKVFRELGQANAAKISLSSLRSLMQTFQYPGITDLIPLMLRMEDAKIMRSQADLDGAIMTCKIISNHLTQNGSEQDHIRAESLLLCGLWMAQNNVDSVETILSSYFVKAARLAMQIHEKMPTKLNAHRASIASFKLGEFTANLYHSIDARLSSDAWRRRNIAAHERNRELQAVTSQLKELQKKSRATSNDNATVDARIMQATLSKEVEMDERELKSVERSMQRYLQLAMESYCAALKVAPTVMTDVSKYVFELISMWFKNCQRKGTEDIVNKILKSNIYQIPSYRLVPLTYQLFSRIDQIQGADRCEFQNILRDVVCKICSEHPYHGIVQILALSNGQRIGGGVNGRHAQLYSKNVGTTKVDAVNRIIQDLRKHAPDYVSSLIDSYDILMSAYINLAEFDVTNIQKRSTKGLSFKQYKLDLDTCLFGGHRGKKNAASTMPAIITKMPPVRPDAQYGLGKEDPIGIERVESFEPTFDLTPTGLHRPKIVICIGSKGGRFKQLVKGEDDLRQDAIMQQVFGTVNDLLRHEGSGGKDIRNNSFRDTPGLVRRLRLITYGIAPLSPTSGVLEWVDNTMCFGDFLSDRGKRVGAHSKYYPGEWGYNDARDLYRNVGDDPAATIESKRRAFDKICENYSPAFRFFFLEYFNSSMEAWHTARTLYTRSCAVNSIVGHILGIGDRHTSNILVHAKTGEVVHIDFGIVFEQGKTLTTPELVPFRLTRNVVDGMGPSGTDGVFSAAGQATMSVMRNNADTLLTILSAVVSDPLYKWSISPLISQQRQNYDDESRLDFPCARMFSSDENKNDAADRAIAKIHEKLQGYEDGTSGVHKTIAGQVKFLINEARDRDNLCLMFAGWAPWM